jgi:hypothetical protein
VRYFRGRIKWSCDGQVHALRTSPQSTQSLVHQIHHNRASEAGIPAATSASASSCVGIV